MATKPTNNQCKPVPVSVRLTPRQRAALKKEAAKKGESMAALLRGQILKHADTLCEAELQALEAPFVPQDKLDARDARQVKRLTHQKGALDRKIAQLEKKIRVEVSNKNKAQTARKKALEEKITKWLKAARQDLSEKQAECATICKAIAAFKEPCKCSLPKASKEKPPSPSKTVDVETALYSHMVHYPKGCPVESMDDETLTHLKSKGLIQKGFSCVESETGQKSKFSHLTEKGHGAARKVALGFAKLEKGSGQQTYKTMASKPWAGPKATPKKTVPKKAAPKKAASKSKAKPQDEDSRKALKSDIKDFFAELGL